MKEIISSRSNRIIVEATKLKDKKYRDKSSLYIFEGIKLFYEALMSKVSFESIFVTENSYNKYKNKLDSIELPLYTVTENVYSKLTLDFSPDGIFCVCKKQEKQNGTISKPFILSGVRDPGNLGTVIRSARAFGIETLVLHDCVDVYNPKVIRASMGAFFRQNIIFKSDLVSYIKELEADNKKVYPTALSDNSKSLFDIEIDENTVFIIGNEGHGLSEDIISACSACPVIIPMSGDTESLNACVAASLLMWELSK